MSRPDASTSLSMVAMVAMFSALLTSSAAFVAAEPPASSPTGQKEKATAADAGEIQSREISRTLRTLGETRSQGSAGKGLRTSPVTPPTPGTVNQDTIMQRGVEGEPATTAPTGQKDKTTAPK